MFGEECGEICGKCRGGKKIVLGLLVLLNIYVWPKWTGNIDNWLGFFAVLLIIAGVIKFAMPTCPHCKAEMSAKPAKKGK